MMYHRWRWSWRRVRRKNVYTSTFLNVQKIHDLYRNLLSRHRVWRSGYHACPIFFCFQRVVVPILTVVTDLCVRSAVHTSERVSVPSISPHSPYPHFSSLLVWYGPRYFCRFFLGRFWDYVGTFAESLSPPYYLKIFPRSIQRDPRPYSFFIVCGSTVTADGASDPRRIWADILWHDHHATRLNSHKSVYSGKELCGRVKGERGIEKREKSILNFLNNFFDVSLFDL